MSEIDIIVQEIEDCQALIGSAFYLAKTTLHVEALEAIAKALNIAVDDIAQAMPAYLPKLD